MVHSMIYLFHVKIDKKQTQLLNSAGGIISKYPPIISTAAASIPQEFPSTSVYCDQRNEVSDSSFANLVNLQTQGCDEGIPTYLIYMSF